MYHLGDENVVTRDLQEPNPIFPQEQWIHEFIVLSDLVEPNYCEY